MNAKRRILLASVMLTALLCGCAADAAPAPMEFPAPTAIPATPQATVSTTPTPVPTPTPEPAPALPAGAVSLAEGFYYTELDDALKARITGMSYPAPGTPCKIAYEDLRYLKLLYYDFSENVCVGELMVNSQLADEVLEIFHALYEAKYPLASVRLVDDYGEPGDDNVSMAQNNTSAFNYRRVTGSSKLSRHSYGAAIDINPVQNPYINGERVSPESGREYLDRTDIRPGMLHHDDICYQLFTQYGWSWGGDFRGDKDYQHFSKKLKDWE